MSAVPLCLRSFACQADTAVETLISTGSLALLSNTQMPDSTGFVGATGDTVAHAVARLTVSSASSRFLMAWSAEAKMVGIEPLGLNLSLMVRGQALHKQ
jgi:hypothetical protein